MTVIDEPVRECAPLARRLAAELCHKDPASSESCAWYHGFWQDLRTLGLITTPGHHADFLREACGVVAAVNACPRILVSGAADFSTYAHVLWACRQHNAIPSITVVDVCETPLALNRWYAERTGHAIETQRADILDYRSLDPFDAVCTHSFFGRFLPEERPRLASAWARLLKPGGIAMAVNRVRAQAANERLGFNPQQARAFRDNVVRKAEAMRDDLDVTPAELGVRAEAYAARHQVYPVHSQDEVRDFFERGGLKVETMRNISVSKAVDKAVGGPTTLEGAGYACIIARKP